MTPTVLNINFSAGIQQGAIDYIRLMAENVKHISHSYQVEERVVKTTQGSDGSYWVGMMWILVEPSELNQAIVQIDSVKAGYIQGAAPIYEHIFNDTRVEIVSDSIDSVVPLIQQNSYLMNKVQEQSRAIENLEGQVYNLTKLGNGFQNQINALTERYREHHAYMHDFIDFNNLIRVVRELAEKVDDEILDNYPLQKVH